LIGVAGKASNALPLHSVQLKRTLISLVLLLAYGLGFAHNVIPHCHDGEGMHEHHASHSHSHDHDHDHAHDHDASDHIAHKDHLDENLIDLLMCVLSETEHSEPHQEHVMVNTIAPKPNDVKAQWQLAWMAAIVLLIDPETDDQSQWPTMVTTSTQEGCVGFHPLRGPPVIS